MNDAPISPALRQQVKLALQDRLAQRLVQLLGHGRALLLMAVPRRSRSTDDQEHFVEQAHASLQDLMDQGAPIDAELLRDIGLRLDSEVPNAARVVEIGDIQLISGMRFMVVRLACNGVVVRSKLN
jgi:hypothetical protein